MKIEKNVQITPGYYTTVTIIPDKDTKREDKKQEVIIRVPKIEGIDLERYYACIVDEGETWISYPIPPREDGKPPVVVGIGKDGEPVIESDPNGGIVGIGTYDGPIDTGSRYDPIPGTEGHGPTSGGTISGTSGRDEKDDDDDKGGIGIAAPTGGEIAGVTGLGGTGLGPFVIIGGCLLLASALVLGTVQNVCDTNIYHSKEENNITEVVSNISLEEFNTEFVHYIESSEHNPGKLIHHVRYSNMGIRGMKQDEMPIDQLKEEEDYIMQIRDAFVEEEDKIAEAGRILQLPTIKKGEHRDEECATPEQKVQAIRDILDAKKKIRSLYTDNQEQFVGYAHSAIEAYEESGNDPTTLKEIDEVREDMAIYGTEIRNLDMDIEHLERVIDAVENPTVFFEEKIAEGGEEIRRFLFKFNIFGQEIGWETSKTNVESLEYVPDANNIGNVENVHDGAIHVSEEAIQKTNTTRRGFSAIWDIVKRAAKGQDIGTIKLFGFTLHKGEDIHGHERKAQNRADVQELSKMDKDDR